MNPIRLNTDYFGEDLKALTAQLLPEAKSKLVDLREGGGPWEGYTGWYDFPRREGMELSQEIESYSQSLHLRYDTVLVIGIGGSYLGAKALHAALTHRYASLLSSKESQLGHKNLLFAGHTLSEREHLELIEVLNEKEPLVVVISKSGTTLEPGVAFRILRSYMEQRYGASEARKRIIAVTDPQKGALRSFAEQKGYQTFPIPADVGGRFSVFTAVGLVPLHLAGLPIKELLNGADQVFRSLEQAADDHPVLAFAAARLAAYKRVKVLELIVYSDLKLHAFTEWYKQLFAESEGKNHQGLFPASLALTTDLHSLGQWVQEGPRNLFEVFLAIKGDSPKAPFGLRQSLEVPISGDHLDGMDFASGKSLSELNELALKATRLAHFEGGAPSLTLELAECDAHHLGAFMAFLQVSCGISAAMSGVHPYTQPGVESYKKHLFAMLK